MATPQGRRLGYHTPEQVSNPEPPDSRPCVLTTTLLGGTFADWESESVVPPPGPGNPSCKFELQPAATLNCQRWCSLGSGPGPHWQASLVTVLVVTLWADSETAMIMMGRLEERRRPKQL